jgi:hypothetical protein
MNVGVKDKIHDLVFDFYLGTNLAKEQKQKSTRTDLILQSVFVYTTQSLASMNYEQGEHALCILDKEPTFENMFHLFGDREQIDLQTFVEKMNSFLDTNISKMDVPIGFEGVVSQISLESVLNKEEDLSFLTSNLQSINKNSRDRTVPASNAAIATRYINHISANSTDKRPPQTTADGGTSVETFLNGLEKGGYATTV